MFHGAEIWPAHTRELFENIGKMEKKMEKMTKRLVEIENDDWLEKGKEKKCEKNDRNLNKSDENWQTKNI